MEKKKLCLATLIIAGLVPLGAYSGVKGTQNLLESTYADTYRRSVSEIYEHKMTEAERDIEKHTQAELNKALGIKASSKFPIGQTKKAYLEYISPKKMEEAEAEAFKIVKAAREKSSNILTFAGGLTGTCVGAAIGIMGINAITNAKRKEEDENTVQK